MQNIKATAADTADPLQFAEVFRDELGKLRPDRTLPKGEDVAKTYAAMDASPMAALCLSGGGVRSAAFALGVMQALARFGLLGEFHYLSTVSGGGYAGSFLSAWRHQAASDQEVFADLDRTAHPLGEEAPEIGGIRGNSNYLTPRRGVLSADTWTALALVIRNLVLNWLVFLPFFMGVLYIPWLCNDLVMRPPGWMHSSAGYLLAAGAAALTVGFAFASYGRRRAIGPWLTDKRFVLLVLGPITLASIAFTGAAAVHATQTLPSVLGAVAGAVCYSAAWLLAGVFSRNDLPGSRRDGGRPILGTQLKDWAAWASAGAVAGLLLMLGLHYGETLQGNYSPERLVVLGISWTMVAIFGGELVYVGLRSYAERGDMDREWLGRAAGWLAAGAAGWSLFSAVALFGPHALSFGNAWLAGLLATGGVSGAISLLLGSSAKTAATAAAKVGSRLAPTQIVSIAGVVFAVFLAILLSLADGSLSEFVMSRFPALRDRPYLVDAGGLTTLTAFSVALSWFVNVNRFSLHSLYRNRLIRAFLGSARARARPERRPDPFTGFDQEDNPKLASLPTSSLMHVVNVTLNVVSSEQLA